MKTSAKVDVKPSKQEEISAADLQEEEEIEVAQTVQEELSTELASDEKRKDAVIKPQLKESTNVEVFEDDSVKKSTRTEEITIKKKKKIKKIISKGKKKSPEKTSVEQIGQEESEEESEEESSSEETESEEERKVEIQTTETVVLKETVNVQEFGDDVKKSSFVEEVSVIKKTEKKVTSVSSKKENQEVEIIDDASNRTTDLVDKSRVVEIVKPVEPAGNEEESSEESSEESDVSSSDVEEKGIPQKDENKKSPLQSQLKESTNVEEFGDESMEKGILEEEVTARKQKEQKTKPKKKEKDLPEVVTEQIVDMPKKSDKLETSSKTKSDETTDLESRVDELSSKVEEEKTVKTIEVNKESKKTSIQPQLKESTAVEEFENEKC